MSPNQVDGPGYLVDLATCVVSLGRLRRVGAGWSQLVSIQILQELENLDSHCWRRDCAQRVTAPPKRLALLAALLILRRPRPMLRKGCTCKSYGSAYYCYSHRILNISYRCVPSCWPRLPRGSPPLVEGGWLALYRKEWLVMVPFFFSTTTTFGALYLFLTSRSPQAVRTVITATARATRKTQAGAIHGFLKWSRDGVVGVVRMVLIIMTQFCFWWGGDMTEAPLQFSGPSSSPPNPAETTPNAPEA